MKQNYQKSILMLLVCLMGMFASCVKEAFSVNVDEANAQDQGKTLCGWCGKGK